MKDQKAKEIQEIQDKHDSALHESKQLVDHFQTKHSDSLKEIDNHKQKVQELTQKQQELIKESGVKSKQHFLLTAIKLKVQKMSQNKLKDEKAALKTNLDQVHDEKEKEKKHLISAKEEYETKIKESQKESKDLQSKIDADQKEKDLIKSTHFKDMNGV